MLIFISVSALLVVAYSILMSRYFYGIQKLKKRSVSHSFFPSITVVISVKNEERNLPSLLVKLSKLHYKGALDFVIVDDHSTDSTPLVIQNFKSLPVTYLKNNGVGKKQALETGIRNSTSEWIAVTDADCLMQQNWLNAMVQAIDTDTKMVLGPVFIDSGAKDVFDFQKLEFYALQGATAGSAAIYEPISANAANMLFATDVFAELNPFETNLDLPTGDDQFLMMAIQKAYPGGIQYSFNRDAIVTTFPVTTWMGYWQQKVRWASKGSSYTDWNILITGLVVFITSLLVIESVVVAVLYQQYYLFVFLAVKMIFDFILIRSMAQFANERVNPVNYLISGFLYPVVVVISVVSGFSKRH